MKRTYLISLLLIFAQLACVVVDLSSTPQPTREITIVTALPRATLAASMTSENPANTPANTPTLQVTSIVTCSVNTLALNVRTGPGLSYSVFAWLYAGDSVTVFQEDYSPDWLPVKIGGLTGWIHSNYCEVQP